MRNSVIHLSSSFAEQIQLGGIFANPEAAEDFAAGDQRWGLATFEEIQHKTGPCFLVEGDRLYTRKSVLEGSEIPLGIVPAADGFSGLGALLDLGDVHRRCDPMGRTILAQDKGKKAFAGVPMFETGEIKEVGARR